MNEAIEMRFGRYLAGEAGIEEREALEKEMESNPGLRQQFLLYQKIWQKGHIGQPMEWNADSAWEKFATDHNIEIPQRSKNRTRSLSWAVAAALVLALGAAVYLWVDSKTVTYAYGQENTDPLVLADGSKIYLNESASLKVHSFNKKKRIVELEGEAYFEVSPNAKKPFIVIAGNTLTEVAGTEFNIHQTDDQVTIFVNSGKVIFSSDKHESITIALTSGEAAVFKNEEIRRIPNPSPNLHSWHSRELSFNKNMPISDIISDISAYFGREITFENENVKKCRVTIPLSFKEPVFESVLAAVVAPVSAEVSMEGDKCIIKGGISCD